MPLLSLRLFALRSALPIGLLLAWEFVSRSRWIAEALLPAPSAVLMALLRELMQDALWGDIAITLMRLLAGLTIALVVGVVVGLAASQNRWASALAESSMRLFAPIPKIALYPALILLLGFDNAPKIMLVAADCFFPILLASYQGAKQVETKLLWSAHAMGVRGCRMLTTVSFPASLPHLMAGVRIAATVACVVVFLAEMIASSDGLGHRLVNAARNFQTVEMFLPLVIISALGLVLNSVISCVQRRLDH